MKEIYLKIKEIIQKNYKKELDGNILDIITISTMALYLQQPDLTLKKLPDIMNKIDILSGEEKISSYILQKHPNYPWNSALDSQSAMVVRALKAKSKPVEEEWTMAISTKNIENDIVNMVAKTIHELTHLFRFFGIEESKREIVIKDGVCFTTLDKKKGKRTTDNYNFEEGIVEFYTKETLEKFYKYLELENDLSFSSKLEMLKNNHNGEYKNVYALQVTVIELLCSNPKFRELIDESFEPSSTYPSLITYYNNINNNHAAFSILSSGLDRAVENSKKGNMKVASLIIDGLKPVIKKVVDEAKRTENAIKLIR